MNSHIDEVVSSWECLLLNKCLVKLNGRLFLRVYDNTIIIESPVLPGRIKVSKERERVFNRLNEEGFYFFDGDIDICMRKCLFVLSGYGVIIITGGCEDRVY